MHFKKFDRLRLSMISQWLIDRVTWPRQKGKLGAGRARPVKVKGRHAEIFRFFPSQFSIMDGNCSPGWQNERQIGLDEDAPGQVGHGLPGGLACDFGCACEGSVSGVDLGTPV